MSRYKDKTWQESMRLRFDFNNMMAEYIGEEQGIERKDIEKLRPKLEKAAEDLKAKRDAGELQWMDLPYTQSEVVAGYLATAEYIKENFDTFVVRYWWFCTRTYCRTAGDKPLALQ